MQCQSCNAELSPNTTMCPNCNISVRPVEGRDLSNALNTDNTPYSEDISYIEYGTFQEHRSAPVPPPMPGAPPQATIPTAYNMYSNQSYQPSPPYSMPFPSVPVPQPSRRRLSVYGIVLIALAVVLLLLGGSGLIFYSVIYHPAQLAAQATVTAVAQTAIANDPQTIYTKATSGTPVIDDPLNNAQNSVWLTFQQNGGGCAFKDGAYHITEPNSGRYFRCNPAGSFSDFAFQVQMTIITGDKGGIMFRSSQGGHFYSLSLATDGFYRVFIYINNTGPDAQLLQEAYAPSFKTGFNQTNTITIIARGNKFYLYVNKEFVSSMTDNTYSSGTISLFAYDAQQPTDVAFTNAQIWVL